MSGPTPFEITATAAELEDLRTRLARTRWPDTAVENEDWAYGASTAYVKELAEFWRTCDWRTQEAYLNGGLGCGARHYKVRLRCEAGNPGSGLELHYVHARAAMSPGVPLLLLHGWPGSWYEFHRLIPILVAAGFDVVAPSLPGYGFSEAPRSRGFGPVAMARTMDLLMRQLGYPAFVCQGGDWGSAICRALGQLASLGQISSCKAAHFNMINCGPPPREKLKELASSYSDWDHRGLAALAEYQLNDSGYSKIQGTKPQTVGVALSDSPAGLLAWIVEKLRTWSDCGGDPERCFSKIDMVTNVAMYWFGSAAASSARLYYEGPFGHGEAKTDPASAKVQRATVTIPVGFAQFPKEIFWPPRSWLDFAYGDIRRLERLPVGGHFAAWEQPRLLGDEIIKFYTSDVDARQLCNLPSKL